MSQTMIYIFVKDDQNIMIRSDNRTYRQNRLASASKVTLKSAFTPSKRSTKTNKSQQTVKRARPKASISIPIPLNLSPSQLNKILQERKQLELKQIKKSVALTKYYDCLLSLFMIMFTSSQVIVSNSFALKDRGLGLFGGGFVGVMFRVWDMSRNWIYNERVRLLAINILKIARNPQEYQQKMEFICRKVALHSQKRKQIQMAFLSVPLSSFWMKLRHHIALTHHLDYFEDLFELETEKLSYMDFSSLMINFVASHQFSQELKNCTSIEAQHNFTIQFSLIEYLCLINEGKEHMIIQKTTKNEGRRCQIY